jgi:Co/Zn/Cd efflux system component
MQQVKMQKTVYKVSAMDCPSEENLIRMKLDGISAIQTLEFDIPNRTLTVYHDGELNRIETSINDLNLGGERVASLEAGRIEFPQDQEQKKLLWTVLVINFLFFLIEIIAGLMADSMGLVADSLDMLADSFVYTISLFAVGGPLIRKKRTARVAGYFQIALSVTGMIEVLRRFFGLEQMPDFATMVMVSALALTANAFCLYLLQKSKSKETHMRASMIFTSNDVIINLGVIAAGVLVKVSNSNIPDLIIGGIVFVLVIEGAFRILRLGK